MRTFFKNDLYHFAAHDPRRPPQPHKDKPQIPEEKEEDYISRPIDDKLTIDIPQENPIPEEEMDLSLMLKGFKKKKDKKSQEQTASKEKNEDNQQKVQIKQKEKEQGKNVPLDQKVKGQKEKKIEKKELNLNIFKNSHLIKTNLEEKPEPVQEITEKEKTKKLIENHKYFKKLEYEWKKEGYKAREEERKKEQADKKQEKQGQEKEVDEKQGEESDKQQKAREERDQKHERNNKNKKIKKQPNYVRLDLKRKYKDRFLGSLNANLRRFTRNGRLKPQFKKFNNEVVIQDGELYNSYVSSLSKALCMEIDLDSDEDHEVSSSENIQEPELPASYSYEDLKRYLKDAFGFDDFREGQFETISNILEGKSVLFISQTASGKSLTYIMSSMVLGGLSMVVSPLVSLILDQLAHLPPYLPAACISSLINREQRDRIISLVKSGSIKLLFITPESLQTDFIYHLQDFPVMNFVCVDEAHSLSQLSHNFRTSFLGLGEILQKHVRYRLGTPTILGLTATANPETTESIRQRLSIDVEIRSKSCMNKNLYVTVSRQRGSQKFESLITYLRQPQITKCRGILIYTRTRKIMFEVYNFVTNSTQLNTAIYNSALTNKEKTDTLAKFRNGTIKVVVATIALGMGLDFSNLECVIHINMPKSIENYVQEIGRAGRRQKRAYCHLFLDQNDYITERNYIIADELEPQTLVSLYGKLQENSCQHEKIKNSKTSQKEQADMAIKRAALIIQHKGNQEVIEEEEVQEDEDQEDPVLEAGDCLRSQLYCIRIQKLTAATQLREEALLTLLLKIQALMKTWDVRLRVLPTSSEMLKVSFFKKNEEELKKQNDFFRHLVSGCKKAKGTFYIPLIQKCNKMGLRPIELLTTLYRISNTHTLRVELDFPVYVWQFEGKRRFTEEDPIDHLIMRSFERLNSGEEVDQVLQQINKVQRTSLFKLNALFTVCFLHSRNNMNSIVSKNYLIPISQPIPHDSISVKFDEYFRSGLKDFYLRLTNNQEEIYIPTTCVQQKEKKEIYDCVVLFLKNQMNLDEVYNEFEREEMRRKSFLQFQDGKVITKVLMGVNSGEVSWKIYGERNYWMLFKSKNYEELLETVREQLAHYKETYSIRGYE